MTHTVWRRTKFGKLYSNLANCTLANVNLGTCDSAWCNLVEHADEGSKDHVTGSSVEADLAVAGEAWETPWNVARESDGEHCAPRFVKADDCWKPGLKGKAQSYLMQPSGQRAFWQEEFIPEDPKELEPAQGSRG